MHPVQHIHPSGPVDILVAKGMEALHSRAERGDSTWHVQSPGTLTNGSGDKHKAVLSSHVSYATPEEVTWESKPSKSDAANHGQSHGIANGSHIDREEAIRDVHSDTTAIKWDEPDQKKDLNLKQPPPPLPEAVLEAIPLSALPADAEQFLRFELEEDKKSSPHVESEQEIGCKSGNDTPMHTPDLRDDDEEDLKPKAKPGLPRSIAHLPRAEKEVYLLSVLLLSLARLCALIAHQAMSTFEEIESSIYQNKQIGLMHQQEDSMVCECSFDPSEPSASNIIEFSDSLFIDGAQRSTILSTPVDKGVDASTV